MSGRTNGPPGGIAAGPTCRCGHTRNQHSREGCTWVEEKGGRWVECKCKVTYNEIK